MAVMVWCQSCKEVVWAYDHQKPVDLRGLCNLLKLPCPSCGEVGNFDGWESNNAYQELKDTPGETISDDWSAMRAVAHVMGVEWEPSGDNKWFSDELGDQIKNLIKWDRR